MAAPVNWRIKGVNKTTRQMAADAAARSGLSVAEWLERAINNNAGVLPREKDTPLVSASLLGPARERAAPEDDDQAPANGGSQTEASGNETDTAPAPADEREGDRLSDHQEKQDQNVAIEESERQDAENVRLKRRNRNSGCFRTTRRISPGASRTFPRLFLLVRPDVRRAVCRVLSAVFSSFPLSRPPIGLSMRMPRTS